MRIFCEKTTNLNFIFLVSIFLIIFSLILPTFTNAHTSTCNSGSESVGWIVDCKAHAGTKNINYKFDPSIESAYKTYTTTGAARWSNTSVVSIVQLSTSNNVVKTYGGPDSDTVAVTTIWNTPTGHLNRWELSYNRYVMGDRTATQNNGTATHELGHGIGLNDLYDRANINKIMYYGSTRTVYSPTTSDITGAKEATK